MAAKESPAGRTATPGTRQDVELGLRRLTIELNQLVHDLAHRYDLHATDLRAIGAILEASGDGDPVSPGQLGEALNLTSASVTALVDRLERVGHLRRTRHPHDRRRVVLELEPPARQLGITMFAAVTADMRTAMDGFSDAELATVNRFLIAMNTAVTGYRTRTKAPRQQRPEQDRR